MEHFQYFYFSRLPRELCSKMSSSSSSTDCSLSDILAEIQVLKEKLVAIVGAISVVKQQCQAIHDVLEGDECIDVDMDDDSDGDEPSRVRLGPLGRAATVSSAVASSGGSAGLGVLSSAGVSSGDGTPSQSTEKATGPFKALYRFR